MRSAAASTTRSIELQLVYHSDDHVLIRAKIDVLNEATHHAGGEHDEHGRARRVERALRSSSCPGTDIRGSIADRVFFGHLTFQDYSQVVQSGVI